MTQPNRKPATPETRAAARRVKHAKRAEIARAEELNAPLRDPPPNEAVLRYIDLAEQQDAIAKEKRKAARRDSLKQADKQRLWGEARDAEATAKAHRKAADAARTEQLEKWRSNQGLTETFIQSHRQGVPLEPTDTEVHAFLRDEDGALVRNDKGLPTLGTEKATTIRRKGGLEWLRDKDRITREQYRVGKEYERICTEAHSAALPAGGAMGQKVQTSNAPTIAEARLCAIEAKRFVDATILRPFGEAGGRPMVTLLERICFEGRTVRDLAGGDDRQAIRIEERLSMALSLARAGIHEWEGEQRRRREAAREMVRQ